MLYLVIQERPVESANGVITEFSLGKRIADSTKVQAWVGNPSSKQTLVTTAPGTGQFRVTGDYSVEFGVAPQQSGPPFFLYLTDERQNVYDLQFEEVLTPTSDTSVWSYAKTPVSVDQFMLIAGSPGVVRTRVDSSPSAIEYVNDPSAKTITFGEYGAPRPGDPDPTATYFAVGAAQSNSCTRP